MIKEENVEKIILGYPIALSSQKTTHTLKVEEFRNKLEAFLEKQNLKTSIEYFDERFTSSIAQHNMLSSGLKKSKRRDKGIIDSISAQIILQNYIDKHSKGT